MKVIAFNGSPRKEGNTSILLGQVLRELENEKMETELVHLKGPLRGCIACGKCLERRDGKCAFDADIINSCIKKMTEADGILLGSPTYFSDLTPELKALIDRSGFVAKANGDLLAASSSALPWWLLDGQEPSHVFDSINHFFLISQMIIPGSSYWNIGLGREAGEVERDREGLQTMDTLGKNMAWLINNINERSRGVRCEVVPKPNYHVFYSLDCVLIT